MPKKKQETLSYFYFELLRLYGVARLRVMSVKIICYCCSFWYRGRSENWI